MISAHNISFTAGKKYLVKNVTAHFEGGEVVAIMGPNGAGKTTFLKMLAAGLPLHSGQVIFKEKSLPAYNAEDLAVERGVLSQFYQINFPVTVEEIIAMGRYPYFQLQPTEHDKVIIENVVRQLGIKHLFERDYNSLSGGEAQKVQMARVLAQVWNDEGQSSKALFLDEPVSNLDIRYQHEILGIARAYSTKGNAVIAVLHDINLALQYADRIYFMKDGVIMYEYQHGEDLSLDLLQQVFDIPFQTFTGPMNRPVLIPIV